MLMEVGRRFCRMKTHSKVLFNVHYWAHLGVSQVDGYCTLSLDCRRFIVVATDFLTVNPQRSKSGQ